MQYFKEINKILSVVENAKDELTERLRQKSQKPIDSEKLDLAVEPTEKEYREMYKVGKELGMAEDVEIVDMPAITGIKDPELEIIDIPPTGIIKDPEKAIEEKDKVKENHLDIETMRPLMKETLGFLTNSKIPTKWRDQATVNMIVFVDKQELGSRKGITIGGKVTRSSILLKDPRLSQNLYLFQNKERRLLPANEVERKNFKWKIAHEIWHINEPRTEKIFDDQDEEWKKAKQAQEEKGSVSDYAHIMGIKGKEDEYRAEHFAAWVTDSPKLCPEMKEFFDFLFDVYFS